MSLRQILFAAIGIVAIGIAACSTLKKNDSDKDIRLFLGSFESNLKLTDNEILKQFEVRQSREAVLSAVHVLQNKESEYILCTMAYLDATIERTTDSIKVQIPAAFTTRNIEHDDTHAESILTLWLKENQHGYTIVKLGGEKFYQDFMALKGSISWSTDRLEALKNREVIYTKAREIQKQYDSVVWYATYLSKNYFYVINGRWKSERGNYSDLLTQKDEYKMGLVDEAGTVIIPVEYELIGTPGFAKPQWVEVTKDGKTGYFNLETRKLTIEPAYDMIIPYEKAEVYAITRTDSTYGWIDNEYQYHEGFHSPEVEQWVKTFQFLSAELTIESGKQALCEIPNSDYTGWCIAIPPSYYVKTGLFNAIETDITSWDMPEGGSIGDIKTKGTLFEKITDGISALITTVEENYVMGRESFYAFNRLAFVSPNHTLLNITELPGERIIRIKRLEDNLIEIKTQPQTYDMPDYSGEYELPKYTYFLIDGNKVIEQKSLRTHNFVEFAKLDSSYITGTFNYWDPETETKKEVSALPREILEYMRNEIFAGYGFKFTDSLNIARFENYPNDIADIDEIRGALTGIDQHNVEFLERMMDLMEEKPVAKKPI